MRGFMIKNDPVVENGFTLIEIMIAIVVLSIGFLASASMQLLAVDVNSSANCITEATNLAQRKLEEVMARQYTHVFTDPDLINDATAGSFELFSDINGNGLWDFGESYVDSNGNGFWDGAHVDLNPPPGYVISWSVIDDKPVPFAKHIRMYVSQRNKKNTILLTCIKPRE